MSIEEKLLAFTNKTDLNDVDDEEIEQFWYHPQSVEIRMDFEIFVLRKIIKLHQSISDEALAMFKEDMYWSKRSAQEQLN